MPRLKDIPLDFQPGTRWAYSPQSGFDVLARVVEMASGMPFDRFVEQRIFAPLGMKDTFFYRDGLAPRKPTLYQRATVRCRRPGCGFDERRLFLRRRRDVEHRRRLSAVRADARKRRRARRQARILGRASVETMASVFAPDTLPGRMRAKVSGSACVS